MLRVVDNPLTVLSNRERMIATKFAEGMTYREIGEMFFIAPATVRTHLSAIYRKLDVRSKVALAALLADRRLQELDQLPFERRSTDLCGPPVVAVLPFDNLGGEERWTRIAEGLSADIIVDLARYPDLGVIARQTMLSYKERRDDVRSIGRELSADYVMEGTVQAEGQRVRIWVQLVDSRTGVDVWTARYDRSAENLFAMLDSVTENVINVVATCHGQLANLRRDAVRRRPPTSLQAYDCYLLGLEQKHLFTRDSNKEGIRLLTRAVELDPGLARAWTALALAHAVDACNGFSDDVSVSIESWSACVKKALALDPADIYARIMLADLRALQGDIDAAVEEHERVLASSPNNADTLALLAGSLALVGSDAKHGYELAKRAIRLNPNVPWYFGMLGRCCFVLGLYRESLVGLRRSPSDSPATLLFFAMAHAMLGETLRATKIAARLKDEFPSFTPELFINTYPVTNPVAIAAIREGSRRAGLS
ncbi:adenylate cyclase [Mesorhizobium sp. M4B.F.Ca.ET.215.01.1.1]|nr:adenylate cyclase [Mesorhizobium sp. M4B.F.Ca.ET.013.02.1.1]RVD46670.1 adenylate cyclase [Mesorhizobium sp. M4B.F.Ca.ET.019.03.1.1]RWF67781.1 MAG: adenylate cyclase [Mesorhizobium sp.]TGQ18474.1 adenylate cyclase [Mesorhizobium sp. M4B.F.Ca.ET.215.01.1.1]TGQ37044.1 adenylate cyclase [Mesorhizobium sp. M4B.F.Ca.ET.214.01.1.1]TGQ49270.1 adenylate cyclase [Mesorhizobium sp. M00.F.Ca.ET.220.01.1.1]TGQ59337.1 adenylate cyclase [Mesorhizobium sp. M4B.F.Ca.ET.211.01.1.1]TGR09387.1 adenylate cycl